MVQNMVIGLLAKFINSRVNVETNRAQEIVRVIFILPWVSLLREEIGIRRIIPEIPSPTIMSMSF